MQLAGILVPNESVTLGRGSNLPKGAARRSGLRAGKKNLFFLYAAP